MIVVSGPSSQVRQQLVPLQNDFSPSGSSMAAVSVTDEIANGWLAGTGKDLTAVQQEIDDGSQVAGFEITGLKVGAEIDVRKVTGTGRNVIGRLQAGAQPSRQAIVVGAHIDHLGSGKTGSSLAKNDERGNIHFGADDNASGVAGMLEIAEYLVSQRREGKLKLTRDVIFAGWSGEELGLHGSQHFVDSLLPAESGNEQPASFHDFVLSVNANGNFLLNGEVTNVEELEQSLAFIGKSVPDFEVEILTSPTTPIPKRDELIATVKKHGVEKIKFSQDNSSRPIVAAINMDMIGRLEDKLILQGISSSNYWPSIIESKNAVIGLPLTLSGDTDLPTDASSFYQAGIPILSAFTGSHTDYHTPRDTPDKLDYAAASRIAKLIGLITRSLATTDVEPDYLRQQAKAKQTLRSGSRAYLGSVPSYGDDVVGVKLSDVTKGRLRIKLDCRLAM